MNMQLNQEQLRELEKINKRQNALLNQFNRERILLAKLASETPQFDNPLDVWEVQKLRDSLLSK